MGILLAASNIYVPQFIRRRKLEMLFNASADAFQVASPTIKAFSYGDGLKLYARFTRQHIDKAIQQGNEREVKSRLFERAYSIGQKFKADFHIHTVEEVMRMSSIIYKLLKIEFHGEPDGNIVIKNCFFSDYYSGEVCRIISSLDEGLLAGLSEGGKMSFSQRITEGNKCCQAYLEMNRSLI